MLTNTGTQARVCVCTRVNVWRLSYLRTAYRVRNTQAHRLYQHTSTTLATANTNENQSHTLLCSGAVCICMHVHDRECAPDCVLGRYLYATVVIREVYV